MLRLLTLLGKQVIASLLWEAGASRFVDGKVITGNTAALNTIADIELMLSTWTCLLCGIRIKAMWLGLLTLAPISLRLLALSCRRRPFLCKSSIT
jgi:hypothetical protein